MNCITVQLNDKQYDTLQDLIPYVKDHLRHLISIEADDEIRAAFRVEMAIAGEIADALNESKSYIWTDSSGTIELDIAAGHIENIAIPGDNEEACRAAIQNDGYLRRQLQNIFNSSITQYLEECGIEDAYGKHPDMLHIYLLWMACHDINDERFMED